MNPYTCSDGYCTLGRSIGDKIEGNRDAVAFACAIEPRCKAFRYSAKENIGFLCDDTFKKNDFKVKTDREHCVFDSG